MPELEESICHPDFEPARREPRLSPLLPSVRITVGVEAGNHQQSFSVDGEEQHVGKTPKESAADVLVHDWELKRVRAHALNDDADLVAKAASKTGHLAFVPSEGVDQFRAGGLSENNLES